jgi:tRNA threonylcarbamoyladenosine biosynthesis protein TsaB
MTTILAVDTCSNACSVAVYCDGKILSEKFENHLGKQAERLIQLIEESLIEASLNYNSLDALTATIGPGSFTGARIGLSTLKGIRIVCDKPLIGISTLEATMFKALNSTSLKSNSITILIDAKRGQFYKQSFSNSPKIEAIDKAILIDEQTVKADQNNIKGEDFPFTASDVAHIAAIRLNENTQLNTQTPLYIRPPDAKLPQAKSS